MMENRQRLRQILHDRSFRTGQFKLRSGKMSRYYIDVRLTSTHHEGAALIGDLLLDELRALGGADAVAGMALGAVPVVMAMVARSREAGRPVDALLVRKETKDHGAGRRIEGEIKPGLKVLVVDDVVTTAGSTLETIDAVLAEIPGVQIVGVAAVVDRNEGGREALAARGFTLRSLVNVDELFALGEKPA
jgi:orotate phosphoribosyltransferase